MLSQGWLGHTDNVWWIGMSAAFKIIDSQVVGVKSVLP